MDPVYAYVMDPVYAYVMGPVYAYIMDPVYAYIMDPVYAYIIGSSVCLYHGSSVCLCHGSSVCLFLQLTHFIPLINTFLKIFTTSVQDFLKKTVSVDEDSSGFHRKKWPTQKLGTHKKMMS
jgi:hypothetical protein